MTKEYELTDELIWESTTYEPNDKEPLTLQDGRRVAQAAQKKMVEWQDGLCVEHRNYCLLGTWITQGEVKRKHCLYCMQSLLKDFGL